MSLPKTFLDSNVAQAMTSFGPLIYDRVPSARFDSLRGRLAKDVRALEDLARLGTWYGWPFVVSSRVRQEHARAGPYRVGVLVEWDSDLAQSWGDWFSLSTARSENEPACVGLHRALDADEPWLRSLFARFPGNADKHLLVDAICLGCEVFLTMDYRTIWGPSRGSASLPLRIMRPSELLDHVTIQLAAA